MLGVQGAQAASNRGRGIERYVAEQVAAMLSADPGSAALHVDQGLAAPAFLDTLPWRPAVLSGPPARDPGLYHVMSPFEELPLDRVWPLWARRREVGLVVTLYDLIPLVYPNDYLVTAPLRTQYNARLEMLRAADAVLAISASAADDAIRLLGVRRERVVDIAAGCSDLFRPGPAEAPLPGLRPGFLLYVGGLDRRKNVDRLVEAWAGLAPQTRPQLVVACRPEPFQERHLRRLAARLGAAGDLLLTGFVSDAVLLHLYRGCRAHVLPSEYEGFGLPALEAMRCGAATLVSDIGPLRELVPDAEARFDPRRAEAIAAILRRAIEDAEYLGRRRARAPELAAPYTWERVAQRTLGAYEAVLATRSRKAS
ncbi:MAG TPA: glycosyltransferase family 1 protein [Candidatus Dormibacteraeota bacterium]